MSQKTGARVDSHSTGIPKNGSAKETDYTDTSSNIEIDSKCITVYPTTNCYLKFGDSTVTVASDDYDIFVNGTERLAFSIGDNTHVAVIRETSNGTIYISEMV